MMKIEYQKPYIKMLRLNLEKLMVVISGTEIDDDDFEEGAKEFFDEDELSSSSIWEDQFQGTYPDPSQKGRVCGITINSGSASVMACAPALFLKNGNMF